MAASKVPILHVLLSGPEAVPSLPWPGSEADIPGLSSCDRELQSQIYLPACQKELEVKLWERVMLKSAEKEVPN